MAVTQELILLYIILGLSIGVVYGLRKIYHVEARILELDDKITRYLIKGRHKK